MPAERLRPKGTRERPLLLDEILNATVGPTLRRRYWAHRTAHDAHRSIHFHSPPGADRRRQHEPPLRLD